MIANDIKYRLDAPQAVGESQRTMKTLLPLLAAVALAACSQKAPEVIDGRAPDPNASALANATPVELPPAIRAQKTYRCTDQSLVYVNWFVGDKTANLRLTSNGTPTVLKSAEGKSPWTGDDGTTLSGDDEKITFTPTGGKALSCHT